MKSFVRAYAVSTLLALCVLTSALAASSAESTGLPDGDEIVANVNARDEGESVVRNLTMTLTDKRGKERVRETIDFRKYYGDEKRSVLFFLSPANIRDTGFLTFDYPDPDKDDDQWLYLPAARKVRRISASDRGDYFLGTDFTYEDIKKESKYEAGDYNFVTVGQEDVDGVSCYVIEGTPKNESIAEELGYGKVRSWIDPKVWMPRKAEFWDVRGNPLKTVHTLKIDNVDGIWTAMHIVVHNHKTDHTSDFTFSNVDYQKPVDDDLFSERALRRGVQGD